jgi:hypothetical protein
MPQTVRLHLVDKNVLDFTPQGTTAQEFMEAVASVDWTPLNNGGRRFLIHRAHVIYMETLD